MDPPKFVMRSRLTHYRKGRVVINSLNWPRVAVLVPVVSGGLLALVCLRSLSVSSYFALILLGVLPSLILVLFLLRNRFESSFLPLFLLGFSFFLVYGGLLIYRDAVERNWLLNRRLHVAGTWEPPNRFSVETVNGSDFASTLYLSPEATGSSLERYYREGRVRISLTGTVAWYSLDGSFRSYLSSNGYNGVLEPDRVHAVELVDRKRESILSEARRSLNGYLKTIRSRAPTSVSMIQALLIGKKDFSNRLITLLRRYGVYHLFVISGLHVGALYYVMSRMLKSTPELIRGVLVGSVLVSYVTFLSWPVPATRAMVMLGVAGIGFYLRRRTGLVDVALTTVLLFMVVDPLVVFRPGFQLSVAAVMGILAVEPVRRNTSRNLLPSLLVVTTGAFCGVLPVLMYHFGYWSPVGLPGGFLGSLVFPGLLILLGFQLVFLLVGWTSFYRLIEGVLNRSVDWLYAGLSDWPLIFEIKGLTVVGAVFLAVILYLVIRRETSLSMRLTLVVLLLGILVRAGTPYPKSFLLVAADSGTPSVLINTVDGDTGLFLPPGVRLDAYSFDSLSRRLQSMGVHHLNFVVSDYSRRMLLRMDPSFTIGSVTKTGREEGDALPGNVRYDRGSARLTAGSFSVKFKGTHSSGIPLRPNGLAAVTSNNKCLVVRSAVLTSRDLRRLNRSGCETILMEEGAVRFSFSGDVLEGSLGSDEPLFVRLVAKYF